jgi:predicted transcriptional regulator
MELPMKLYSTAETAEKLGCHPSTVRQYAAAYGTAIGHRWAFSDRDIRRLRRKIRQSVGNPNFGPGFGLGRTKKKTSEN